MGEPVVVDLAYTREYSAPYLVVEAIRLWRPVIIRDYHSSHMGMPTWAIYWNNAWLIFNLLAEAVELFGLTDVLRLVTFEGGTGDALDFCCSWWKWGHA
jgi:hypothetical protein